MKMPSPFRRWQRWPLASQILLGVIGILVLTITGGSLLYSQDSGQNLEQQYQLRALGIAQSVSKTPDVIEYLESGDPDHRIQPLAESIRSTTGAAYVVVADRYGIRFSHPNSALIGKRLEEGVLALDGKTHVGIDIGSLGRSANGIAPIFSSHGDVIGEVSVGILETQLNSQLALDTRAIIGYSILILALSALGSLILARRIKRITFGLEPSSIASLLREREALLHGIKEGMLGLDADGRITVINEEAGRLLGLQGHVIGRTLETVVPPSRLRDILAGDIEGTDVVIVTDEYLLVVNRMRVALAGHDIGSVITVRDRTEVEGLVRELHAINGLTEALRAQEHEYANQLHVITGLLEMRAYDELGSYLADVSTTPAAVALTLRSRIESRQLAALLLAKITIAAEQSIALVVTDDSYVGPSPANERTLLTIVGNLVDNAIEALLDKPGPRNIRLHIIDGDGTRIVVTDNGQGIARERIKDVLVDGYTTKPSSPGMRRGLGLAIVSRLVFRLEGTIEITPGPGGVFEITLP